MDIPSCGNVHLCIKYRTSKLIWHGTLLPLVETMQRQLLAENCMISEEIYSIMLNQILLGA
jgi:hypothetical protein